MPFSCFGSCSELLCLLFADCFDHNNIRVNAASKEIGEFCLLRHCITKSSYISIILPSPLSFHQPVEYTYFWMKLELLSEGLWVRVVEVVLQSKMAQMAQLTMSLRLGLSSSFLLEEQSYLQPYWRRRRGMNSDTGTDSQNFSNLWTVHASCYLILWSMHE